MTTEAEKQVIMDQLKQLGLDTLTFHQLVTAHRRNLAMRQYDEQLAHLGKTIEAEGLNVLEYMEKYPYRHNLLDRWYQDHEFFSVKFDMDAKSLSEIQVYALSDDVLESLQIKVTPIPAITRPAP